MCLLCDKPIAEAIKHLKEWYRSYHLEDSAAKVRQKLAVETTEMYNATCDKHLRPLMVLATFCRWWVAFREDVSAECVLANRVRLEICPACLAKEKGLWTSPSCPYTSVCKQINRVKNTPDGYWLHPVKLTHMYAAEAMGVVVSELERVGITLTTDEAIVELAAIGVFSPPIMPNLTKDQKE